MGSCGRFLWQCTESSVCFACVTAWASSIFMAKGHNRWCGLALGPHGKITGSSKLNCLNHRLTFIVYIIVNVKMCRMIQPGGTRVGDPHVRVLWSFRRHWNASDVAVRTSGQAFGLWCCLRQGRGLHAIVATGLHDELIWNLVCVKAGTHHSQSVSYHSTHLLWRRSFRNAGRLFRITAESRSKINVRTSLHVAHVVRFCMML